MKSVNKYIQYSLHYYCIFIFHFIFLFCFIEPENAEKSMIFLYIVYCLSRGDIVVTQDYGVAAMALGKGAFAIHQSGKWYTNENIDQMLMERHLNKKARRASSRNHIKGPRKRTEEDDQRFAESFEKLLRKANNL